MKIMSLRPQLLAARIRRGGLPLLRLLRIRAVERIERETPAQRFTHDRDLSDKAWLRVLLDSVDGQAG
jgi:hypothetical protein